MVRTIFLSTFIAYSFFSSQLILLLIDLFERNRLFGVTFIARNFVGAGLVAEDFVESS